VIDVRSDPDALAHAVADWLLERALAKSAKRFSVVLAGGETPKALYTLLASPPYRERFPWAHTHWFWGDERFVPQDDPRSNYRMAHDALLAHVPVPQSQIHAIPTDGRNPEQGARAYENMLKSFYGAPDFDPARPLFDVVLLGLGDDGHTASLFPASPVLAERTHWALPVIGMKSEARITLTYPALDSAQDVAFIVAGAAKSAMLKRLAARDQTIPASRIQPQGNLHIFADAGAAAQSEGSKP
jgi:6-phosphogluconolactonase